MMHQLSLILVCFAATSSLTSMPMADVPAAATASAPLPIANPIPTIPVVPVAQAATIPIAPIPTESTPQQPLQQSIPAPMQTTPIPAVQPTAVQPLPILQPIAPALPVAPMQIAQSLPAAPVTAISSQDQIITEMKKNIETITSIKSTIKTALNELDDKLLGARKTASEGKDLSMSLLQQSDQSVAQAEFNKVQEKLKSLKETEAFITGSFTQDFNQKISSFNSSVSKLQAFAQTLRTLAPAHTAMQTASTTIQPTPPAEITIKRERSFFSMLTDMLSSIIAYGISGLKKVKDWIKPNHQIDDSQKKSLNTMQQTQPTQLPVANTGISPEMIKDALNLFDTIIKSLENQQLFFITQLQTINQLETTVTIELKKNAIIINFNEYNTSESVTFKKFTSITHTIFTSGFQAFIWTVSNTIDLVKQAYLEYIQPFFSHVSKDVKNKVKNLEHPEHHEDSVVNSAPATQPIANLIKPTTQPIMNSMPQQTSDNSEDSDDKE